MSVESELRPELSAIDNVNADAEVELSPPLASSSPGKSDSSGTQQARQGKRKRDDNSELLQYFERVDEQF
eukprot:superscaffoldBa00002187_g13481